MAVSYTHLDSVQNEFHVALYSSDSSYTPYTAVSYTHLDENGVITNKNQDGFDGIPLYFFQVNVENQGSLPMRVTLAVREQKKGNDPDLPYGDTIPNLVDNGSGGVTVYEDEPEIACQNDLRDMLHVQLYQTEKTDGGYVLKPVEAGADSAAAQKEACLLYTSRCV